MSRSIISLESALVEGQTLRNRAYISGYPEALLYLRDVASRKLKLERAYVVDTLVDRKERQRLLLKQAQLVDAIKQEIEFIDMAFEDAREISQLLKEKHLRLLGKKMYFLQEKESSMASFSNKLKLRVPAFAKKFVVETLDWDYNSKHNVVLNGKVWEIQTKMASFIGSVTPSDMDDAASFIGGIMRREEDEEEKTEEINRTKETIISNLNLGDADATDRNQEYHRMSMYHFKTLKAVQLITFIFQSNVLNQMSAEKVPQMIAVGSDIVRQAMINLKQLLQDRSGYLSVYISFVMKALSTVILIHTEGLHSIENDSTKIGVKSGEAKADSSQGKATTLPSGLQRLALEELRYWIDLVQFSREMDVHLIRKYFLQGDEDFAFRDLTHSVDLEGDSTTIMSAGVNNEIESSVGDEGLIPGNEGFGESSFISEFNRNYENLSAFNIFLSNGIISFGSPTCIDILKCAVAAMHSLLESYTNEFDPVSILPADTMVYIKSITRYASCVIDTHLFRIRDSKGYNFDDPEYLTNIEDECFESIKTATALFRYGVVSTELIHMLRRILNLAEKRSSNYFLVISALQCLHAALTTYIHTDAFKDVKDVSRKKKKMIAVEDNVSQHSKKSKADQDALLEPKNITEIMATMAMGINKNTLSTVLYLTNMHVYSLTVQHQGLSIIKLLLRRPFMSKNEVQDLFEEDDKLEEMADGEDEEEEDDDDDDGDGDRQSGLKEYQRWYKKIWSHDIKKIEEQKFGQPRHRWTLTQMLWYAGNNHLQSTEITEQILLIIHHLSHVSFLCRVIMVERGIERILTRVTEAMPHHVYLMALVEICSEVLNQND